MLEKSFGYHKVIGYKGRKREIGNRPLQKSSFIKSAGCLLIVTLILTKKKKKTNPYLQITHVYLP